jgi:Domain of unknown function (DUF5615)
MHIGEGKCRKQDKNCSRRRYETEVSADADLNEDIVTGVLRRVPEIDFQTASEAGLQGVKDENVLAIASREDRILVSHDRKTMPGHFAEFITQSKCAGVIIVSKKLEISIVIEEIILIWAASEAEEYINSIRQLPI